MKRIITLSLVAAILCAGAAPITAQQTQETKTPRIKTLETGNSFDSVRAYSDGRGVLVQWEMAVETDNAGFYVYRLDGADPVLASPELILGSATTFGAKRVTGERYSFFDPNGSAGSVYYVQNVAMDGRLGGSMQAPVEVVPDLAATGSPSSVELYRQDAESKQRSRVTVETPMLPKALSEEVLSNRLSADSATHDWVVSQPGVRIGVRRDGFVRVTKAELQNAGFNVNGNSTLWQLYREGVEQAILVGPNADYIDFWARGVDRPETDMAMYYLVSGPSAGKRIATKVARPVGGTVTSANYAQEFFQKQRSSYLQQILNGEAENYWGAPIVSNSDTTYNFTLTGVDLASPQAALELRFHGYSLPPADQHSVQITLNGNSLAPATGTGRLPFSKQYTIPTSHLREGANTLVFRSIGPGSDFSLFDSVRIGYARKFAADQNRVKFYTTNYKLSKIQGFSTPNIRVFDMTAEGSPVLWTNLNIIQEGPTYTVRMPSDRGRSMFAVEDSGMLQAASVTANEPAGLKANTNAANLIIITHQNWMAQAQAWANYRTGQGISVKVVEVSKIYDEFNYGDISWIAIRRFLQHAKGNWQTAPNYTLLLGDASFDARNYQGLGYNNFIPTHIVNTVFMETGSDDSLADFNDDGLAEMAIGRIAARNGQEVTTALGKVMAFEAALPTPQARGAVFAYDCYDAVNNYDFQQYSNTLKSQLPGNVPSTMVGRCTGGAQTTLINALNAGPYVVNYSGHGTTGAWGGADFFANSLVPQLTNANNQSIYTMLTCLNGYFLHASNPSLAESLVNLPTGGAVAAWASTGETTPDEQNAMANRFYQRLGVGQLVRIGDLVNDAKTVISGGSDVRLSWALIGDPMLKVRNASVGDRPGKK